MKKNENDAIVFQHKASIKIIWQSRISLSKCSYWSKYHINSIIGSWVMESIRKSEISPSAFFEYLETRRSLGCQILLRFLDETLLNPRKVYVCSSFHFCVITGKTTEEHHLKAMKAKGACNGNCVNCVRRMVIWIRIDYFLHILNSWPHLFSSWPHLKAFIDN